MTKKTNETPIRMCVICRERFPKRELARFVADFSRSPVDESEGSAPAPEQSRPTSRPTLHEDPTQTAPGRGFYACRRPACLEKLPKHRGWMKKVKGGVNGR